ncbi:MAG: geranylgeranylglycerol-phosphate geranylgeranyltransferase [Bacteroidales bacterium]|nr:geranylgeranylglycerol-phosphate geranylgeranyltransferase [Bacteroidales bacterium]
MKPYLQILRPVNLLIIAGTLLLVRCAIFQPIFQQNQLEGLMPWWQFMLLVIATLLIGAGGYVINDVLDVEMDAINKPGKQIINRYISTERGKNLHMRLTVAGVITGMAFSYLSGNIMLGILFVIIPTALFYYSYKYKYMPLVGNLVVAAISAMVVVMYWIFEFYHLKGQPVHFIDASRYFILLNRFVLAFAAFAFLVSLMREIVKDAQDMEGDARFGCKTLPIMLGIPSTRLLVIVLELITITGLGWFQFVLYRSGYIAMAYLLVFTQLFLFIAVIKTFSAKEKPDFTRLSLLFKLTMVAGMLSLIATWFRNI